MTPEDALTLARRAHDGQRDLFGRPFVEHAEAVTAMLGEDATDDLRVVALLHDTVEKGNLTWDDLRRAGTPEPLIDLVDLLTHRPGERTEDYLRRCAQDPRAFLVKQHDLREKLVPELVDGLPPSEAAALREMVEQRLSMLTSFEQEVREQRKRTAGEHAAGFVTSGMVVGLGTGSTAVWAVRRVGERVASGELHDLVAIPTSPETAVEAERLGIPLTTLDQHPVIDLTIDGADEVDPNLNVIKGGGGALLHEKIVAQASRRLVIVVDDAKLSPALGTTFALPVEVVPFGAAPVATLLQQLGASVRRRGGDTPFVTAEGNHILDADFGVIADPATLAARLDRVAGVVEHGLFLGLATDVVVDGRQGIEHRRR